MTRQPDAKPAKRILVVEDNPITLKYLRRALEPEGYRVDTAETGAAALEALDAPAAVILDMTLPDMSGIELARRLRQQLGDRTPPLLACSGSSARLSQARAEGVRFDAELLKPAPPSVLVSTLAGMLENVGKVEPRMPTKPGTRILVVDDQPAQLRYLRLQLSTEGYDVVPCTSAQAALALIHQERPALVLSDVLMPEMDGFELCRQLRADPATHEIPVVLITSSDFGATERTIGDSIGVNALHDRFDRDAILQSIREAITSATSHLPIPADQQLIAQDALQRELSLRLQAQHCSVQRQQLLHELRVFCTSIAESGNTGHACAVLLPACLNAAGLSRGLLYLCDPDGELRLHAQLGSEEFLAAARDRFGIAGELDELVRDRKVLPLSASRGPNQLFEAMLAPHELRSALIAPVASEGSCHGLLVLLSATRDIAAEDFSEFAPIMAAQLALTLSLVRSRERTEEANRSCRDYADRTAELDAANRALEAACTEAERANREKSSFLATMSHEIRTPMSGVLGMVELLGHTDLTSQQADLLATIRESSVLLLGLIDDILDFSKIEASKLRLDRSPLTLSELVEGLCVSMVNSAWNKGVELYVFVDPDLPARILGDEVRIRQLLYNLIGNAIKFSVREGAERGRVEVRAERAEGATSRFRLIVSDNGIGMSESIQRSLFHPFQQGDASITRRFGGTGLGLAICKRLIDMMDGTIEVTSACGIGSRFCVELPLEAAEVLQAEPSKPLQGLYCLLIDDGVLPAGDLQRYLLHAGARVHRCRHLGAADRHLARLPDPTMVIRSSGERGSSEQAVVALAARHPNARVLCLGRGRRRRTRGDVARIYSIDAIALRCRTFLHAVAVAAGRGALDGPKAPSSCAPMPATATEAPTMPRHHRPILVAEDDVICQRVIRHQLQNLGFSADIADDGCQALELWRTGRYGLLLSDLHMPRLSGFALAEAIRREEHDAPRMPILGLTASALRNESHQARACGIDECLTKPISLKALEAALTHWLPQAESRAE